MGCVGTRPDGIEWKRRTVYVADEYDADGWFPFRTRNAVDVVAAPVVALDGGGTGGVWFYVGDC